jgi:hypothetical protein
VGKWSDDEQHRLEPGTLDDLVADAAKLGLHFDERTARDWHRRGLLGSPQRRPLGRGRGSGPALYSSEQRAVFHAVAQNKTAGLRNQWLATIPVWFWLNYSDAWVSLEQLRRALRSAVGNPKLSERAAQQTTQLLLSMVDHKQGRPGDRGQLRDELIRQLRAGRINETKLLPKVKAVFQPPGLHVVRGPAEAPIDVKTFTYLLGVRILAANNIAKISDTQLHVARMQHQTTWPAYQRQRVQLAAEGGSVAHLFGDTDLSSDVTSSVSTLLLLVGMQMHADRKAAARGR